jgi:small subunit ribosomal protein S6
VRDVANWGIFLLPKPSAASGMRYHRGHYFAMRFDTSIETQEEIGRSLKQDPRMIRSAIVRLGNGKLENGSKFGKILWEQAFERH